MEVKSMLAQGKTPAEIMMRFPSFTAGKISLIKTGKIVVNPNIPAPPPFHPSVVFKDMLKERLGFASKAQMGNENARKAKSSPKMTEMDKKREAARAYAAEANKKEDERIAKLLSERPAPRQSKANLLSFD